MTDHDKHDDDAPGFAEDAADATEEARRAKGERRETIQDGLEAGRLIDGPLEEDEPDMRL